MLRARRLHLLIVILLNTVATYAAEQKAGPSFAVGQLPAYTRADVAGPPLTSEFNSLLDSGKVAEAVALAEKAGAAGDPLAFFLLGFVAEHPPSGRADPVKAEICYRRAAKQKHVPSIVNLAALLMRRDSRSEEATLLLQGVADQEPRIAGLFMGIASLTRVSGEPDYQDAAQWWRKAGDAGNAVAWRHLGLLYQGMFGPGNTAEVDPKRAASAFESGVRLGDDESQVRLGILIAQSHAALHRSMDDARASFEKAAQSSDTATLYLLGQVKELGLGDIKADSLAATATYARAAALGHGPSDVKLAKLTAEGRDGDADQAAVADFYRKAADAGEGEGFYQLGLMSQSGRGGLTKDPANAFGYFLQAAQARHVPAFLHVGLAYLHGRGALQDQFAALHWLRRGADAGDTDAMVTLAEMMLSNQGLAFDRALLDELCRRAFDAGNPRAGLLLGRIIERGITQDPDAATAWAYYQRAAQQGLETAKTEAARIVLKLSAEQRATAEAMLQSWQPDVVNPK